jgi:hypothetical protein
MTSRRSWCSDSFCDAISIDGGRIGLPHQFLGLVLLPSSREVVSRKLIIILT